MGPALAPVLRANSGLLELNLGCVARIACAAVDPLSRCSVRLSDTGLEDDGVAAVCRAIATGCRQLEVLNLSANDITPDGAALAVARTIKRLPALRELYLDDVSCEARRFPRGALQAMTPAPVAAHVPAEHRPGERGHQGHRARHHVAGGGRYVASRARGADAWLAHTRRACDYSAADPLATVSMPGCGMGRWGAAALAAACAALPALARLNLNESMISAKGVAELQKLFEGKDDVLTLDDNDEVRLESL